jgi:FkbM family methyltransferase
MRKNDLFKGLKYLLKRFLNLFGIAITTTTNLSSLQSSCHCGSKADIEFLSAMPSRHVERLLKLLEKSSAQIRQDLMVLSKLNFKESGFFVEFGATNGISLSNTNLLEKEFGWRGILAEPAKSWRRELQVNRPKSKIDFRCVYSVSNQKLMFKETNVKELSTLEIFMNNDMHTSNRELGKTYLVETVSLTDLLIENNAPRQIDYLSIDTEGSEYEILKNFDFQSFHIKIITCEHNNTANKKLINQLLTSRGYIQIYDEISKIDDWYIHHSATDKI